MFEHTRTTLATAEEAATEAEALRHLRRLGLDDFGLFLLSLPNSEYPHLSSLLPDMAPDQVQQSWTGASGVTLLRQSVAFMRLLESMYIRHAGQGLGAKRIMDFGCGYGRLTRLLYYHTDPGRIYGVDAWQESLDLCISARMLGTFLKSDEIPAAGSIPVEDIDIAFAFSILTHLSRPAALAVLSAVHESVKPGGLFVVTVRPIEFWAYLDSQGKADAAPDLERMHRAEGFAFRATHSRTHYGDSSIDVDTFRQIDGWTLLDVDRSLIDPFQLAVALRRS